MKQIDLLLTNAERADLLRWVIEQRASIVPDTHYLEAKYRPVASLDQVDSLLDYRQYFVLRSDWQQEDLVMRPVVSKEEGPGFYIAQRHGGPALSLLLYPESIDDSQPVLGRGAIHYYPFYYSAADRTRVAPPGPMKDFFRELSKRVKAGGVSLKGKARVVWLSRSSAAAVSAGGLQVPSEWRAIARKLGGGAH